MIGLFTRQARERERRDELLSAYLDDQLSAGERVRLEAQLATDPALRAELGALRHTVALVRDLPPVSIPRNFILPQKMETMVAARPRPIPSARPRRAWAAPFLTAATAIVSLLFVVVLAGDLLLSGAGRRAFAPMAEPPQAALAPSLLSQEVEVEMAVEAPREALEEPREAPPEATVEAEHYAVETTEDVEAGVPAAGGPTEESTALAPTPNPPVIEKAAEAPTAPATPEGTLSPEQATGGGGPIEESPAPASPPVDEEAGVAPTAPATAAAVPEADVNGAEPTPGEVGEAAPWAIEEEESEAAEGGRGAPEGEVTEPARIPLWRALEVILGLTALGLALVTVRAWRTRRR